MYAELGISNIEQLIFYHTIMLTKNILYNNSLNNGMNNIFSQKERVRSSKFTDNLDVPNKFNYLQFKDSFQCRAILHWNQLPSSIKSIKPNVKFKLKLQKWLNMNPHKFTAKI